MTRKTSHTKGRDWGWCFRFLSTTHVLFLTMALVAGSHSEALGGSMYIGGIPEYGPIVRDQYAPQVAYDGSNFLVVWEDDRAAEFGPAGRDIYGARVTASGVVLDSAGIHICGAPRVQKAADVAFGSGVYLVVWQDHRTEPSKIYGCRLSPDGEVLDPDGFRISTGGGNKLAPSVGFDGTNFMVVWSDYRNGNGDIYFARVSPSGEVLDTEGVPVCLANTHQTYPTVAFGGDQYLVVWQDSRDGNNDIYGARVATDGSVIDSTGGFVISDGTGSQESPEISFGDGQYLVVWQDSRAGSFDIYGARVTTDAAVLDTAGITINTDADVQELPAASYDSDNFLVVWRSAAGSVKIRAARVTPNGEVLDPDGIGISLSSRQIVRTPAVAFGGGHHLVVWADVRSSAPNYYFDIFGARVDPSGTVLDDIWVSLSAREQLCPDVAFGETNYMFVWRERRSTWFGYEDDAIYAARVTQDGTLLDPLRILLAAPGYPSSRSYNWEPAVAYGDSVYLAVWHYLGPGSYPVRGKRILADGTVLDSLPILITDTEYDYEDALGRNLDVEFGKDEFLVVWCRDTEGSPVDIYGARIDAEGTIVQTDIPIVADEYSNVKPRLAFDGNNYILVWQVAGGIACMGLGPHAGYGWGPIWYEASYADNPVVASGPENYLVVWEEGRNAPRRICAGRIAHGGFPLDEVGFVVSTVSCNNARPSVTFDGANYVIVWRDTRGNDGNIYAARVSPDGTVLDPGGFPLVEMEFDQYMPVIAHGINDDLVGFMSLTDPPYGAFRMWALALSSVSGLAPGNNARNQSDRSISVWPNPSPGTVNIYLNLSCSSPIDVDIYDVRGRLVRSLLSSPSAQGCTLVSWDAICSDGTTVAPGVYLCIVRAGSNRWVKKIVIAQ